VTTTAKVVADSVSPQGKRLITWVTRYPWQIHGEVMTHRVFSRNASSNRAVPIAKMLEEVRNPDLRAYPSFAVVAGKGMTGGEPTTPTQRRAFRMAWDQAALKAADAAEVLSTLGAAKQDVNRLLMPFTHANVIITATEVDNFFGLRLDAAADPTMRELAEMMWYSMKASEPKPLKPGEWHLPFIGDNEREAAAFTAMHDAMFDPVQALVKVSVARCARVSYQSFETGKLSTVAEDLALYDRLVGQRVLHASPAEHQATPDQLAKAALPLVEGEVCWEYPEEHGNLVGWRQLRKMLPGESRAPLPEGYSL